MRRTGSVLVFAAISLALHLVWMVWTPTEELPARVEERWVEVSFEEAVVASPAEAEVAVVIEEAVRPERVVRRAVRLSSPSPSPSTPTSTPTSTSTLRPLAPLAVDGVAVGGQLVAAGAEKAVTPPVLSPRAVALSVDAFARTSALRCAAPGSRGQTAGPADCAPDEDHGLVAQAALQRDLNAMAKSIPHLQEREAPALKRRSDGSFAYDGHVFKALLRPDGQAEFTDTSEQAQLRVSLMPLKVVADVNDLVERQVLGRELYSAEKAWFLEQTRELRLQLASEARRRELQQAKRALERTLHDVLADRALSLAQKHDAVFLIWQDCGEEAEQKAHRRSVEAFVRRYMPQDSALGFRVDELERFNAQRGLLQKFEPYSDSAG